MIVEEDRDRENKMRGKEEKEEKGNNLKRKRK